MDISVGVIRTLGPDGKIGTTGECAISNQIQEFKEAVCNPSRNTFFLKKILMYWEIWKWKVLIANGFYGEVLSTETLCFLLLTLTFAHRKLGRVVTVNSYASVHTRHVWTWCNNRCNMIKQFFSTRYLPFFPFYAMRLR